MSRSERLLEFLQILRRHRHPISGKDLSAELGISLRTLYRDIASLQTRSAVIEGEACAYHVQRGRAEGFMQVCHGKSAPLRRLKLGDGAVYYSPAQTMGGKDKLQSFTAQGVICGDGVYQVDMGQGFHPYRRDVQWSDTMIIPIRPVLD